MPPRGWGTPLGYHGSVTEPMKCINCKSANLLTSLESRTSCFHHTLHIVGFAVALLALCSVTFQRVLQFNRTNIFMIAVNKRFQCQILLHFTNTNSKAALLKKVYSRVLAITNLTGRLSAFCGTRRGGPGSHNLVN